MKPFLGKLSVAFAVLLSLAMVSQDSAYAATTVVVIGQGTIWPGLDIVARPDTFTFTSIAGVGASTQPLTADLVSCSFTGGGVQSLIAGASTGSGTCSSGGGMTIICVISYIRVGSIGVVTGSCNGAVDTLVGAFIFEPTSLNPTTSYVLVGEAAVACPTCI